MFGILVSALNSVLAFVVRQVIVKFVLFSALFFVTSEFCQYLGSLLPSASSLNSAFGGIPAGVWWFLDLFAFSYGVPVIVSAYVLRFSIRRIPFLG